MKSQLEENIKGTHVQQLKLPFYSLHTAGKYKIPGTEGIVEICNEYFYPQHAEQIKRLFSIVDNSGQYVQQIKIVSFVPPNMGTTVKRMEEGQITCLGFTACYYLFDEEYSPRVKLSWAEFIKMGKPRTISRMYHESIRLRR